MIKRTQNDYVTHTTTITDDTNEDAIDDVKSYDKHVAVQTEASGSPGM